MNPRILPAIFTPMLMALIGCRTYGAKEAFELAAPWDDYQRIVVRTGNGSVALRTSDVSEIRISGTKHANGLTVSEAEAKLGRVGIVAEPDATDASVFMVRVKYPELLGRHSVGARFDIQVPAPCAADIQTEKGTIAVSGLKDEVILKTGGGQITIDGVSGEVRAHSRNGRIIAENVTGHVTAVTTNAPVWVKGIGGGVSARSRNGEIVAESVTGDLTAATSNAGIRAKVIRGNCKLQTSIGTIEAEDVHGGIEARASIGSIRADVTPPEDANVELRTTYGSIDLTVPAGLKADLDLRTKNGVVQTMLDNVPLRVQLWSQNRVKTMMNGGGGTRILATTCRGLITLEARRAHRP